VSGASEVLLAAIDIRELSKSDVLNVDSKLIDKNGAVSEAVARAMAEWRAPTSSLHVRARSTGIAANGRARTKKPVGTVTSRWLQEIQRLSPRTFVFPTDRETFKQLAPRRRSIFATEIT